MSDFPECNSPESGPFIPDTSKPLSSTVVNSGTTNSKASIPAKVFKLEDSPDLTPPILDEPHYLLFPELNNMDTIFTYIIHM